MKHKGRKNHLPTLILTLILWLLLGLLMVFVEPELVKDIFIPGLYLPFFIIFFPACWLTLTTIFGNSRRGLILGLGINTLLILKVYELSNWLNLILVLGIAVSVDRYLKE